MPAGALSPLHLSLRRPCNVLLRITFTTFFDSALDGGNSSDDDDEDISTIWLAKRLPNLLQSPVVLQTAHLFLCASPSSPTFASPLRRVSTRSSCCLPTHPPGPRCPLAPPPGLDSRSSSRLLCLGQAATRRNTGHPTARRTLIPHKSSTLCRPYLTYKYSGAAPTTSTASPPAARPPAVATASFPSTRRKICWSDCSTTQRRRRRESSKPTPSLLFSSP